MPRIETLADHQRASNPEVSANDVLCEFTAIRNDVSSLLQLRATTPRRLWIFGTLSVPGSLGSQTKRKGKRDGKSKFRRIQLVQKWR